MSITIQIGATDAQVQTEVTKDGVTIRVIYANGTERPPVAGGGTAAPLRLLGPGGREKRTISTGTGPGRTMSPSSARRRTAILSALAELKSGSTAAILDHIGVDIKDGERKYMGQTLRQMTITGHLIPTRPTARRRHKTWMLAPND